MTTRWREMTIIKHKYDQNNKKSMEPPDILALWFSGGNENREGFYRWFFSEMLKYGKVFASEFPRDWDPRSMRRWTARLCDGTKNEVGLQIEEKKREGKGGKVYYRFSYQFLADLNKVWKAVKKVIV